MIRAAIVSAYRDNLIGTAKGAAYSGLLSFFPLLSTIATLLVQANADSVGRSLTSLLTEAVPPGSEPLIISQFATRGQRPASVLVAAGFLSLWGASGMMISLMQGFQAAFGTPNRRGFWHQRGVAVLLIFATAVPMIAASGLLVFGGRTESVVLPLLAFLTQSETVLYVVAWVGLIVRYAVAFGTIVLVMALLYYYGPQWDRRWRDVWPGAVLSTILWLIATTLFTWYVRNVGNYNVLYGSIGAGIALLVWMYFLSVVALFGCEYNVQRNRVGPPR